MIELIKTHTCVCFHINFLTSQWPLLSPLSALLTLPSLWHSVRILIVMKNEIYKKYICADAYG